MLLPCGVKNLEPNNAALALIRNQRTISREISFSGSGLFTGAPVNMTLKPAPEGSGIVFQRGDLPLKPIVPAYVDYIYGTPRCTILAKDQVVVQSVEHILSALSAYDVDNMIIELDGAEVPVGDGSAMPFVELLQKADIQEQDQTVPYYQLTNPVYWSEGNVHLVAIPSKELRYSYTLSYPGHPLLHSQFYTFAMNSERYTEEIAPCRTFSLYEEILPLLEKGIIKGGTLNNGVVIKGKEILNPDGIRFSDEMVRHKMLDFIGDLSLMGVRVMAHFIAIRAGHFSNTELAKKILASINVKGKHAKSE